MPFVNRFASPFAPPKSGLFRKHPFFIATSAATGGVLLGAYVAVQLLATPAKHDDSATSSHAALETRAPPHIAETTGAETTGSASADAVATADCDRQTWPNLTRNCMKNGGARVIPSDTAAAPQSAPAAIASNPPPPIATVAVPDPEPASAAAASQTPLQAAEQTEAKPKHVAKKVKRKLRQPARPELNNDDDDGAFASDDSGDRADPRSGRSRHIVVRGTEREYDVPDDEDGSSRRRVVIRRGGGDSPFGGLFGGFGGGD